MLDSESDREISLAKDMHAAMDWIVSSETNIILDFAVDSLKQTMFSDKTSSRWARQLRNAMFLYFIVYNGAHVMEQLYSQKLE